MKMINIRRYGLGLLLIWGVLMHVPALGQGATGYEASSVTFSDPVTTGQYVRLTSDLIVSWNAPTASAQVDPNNVMNYYLLFNTSGATLTDQQLNDTTNDFAVDGALESKTIASTFFNTYDSNNIRYLHIKTQYATTTGGFAYSDDVVVGPIRIDNVAPTGTITLDPSGGSSTQLTVSISPSEPIQYFWLSEAATFPGGTGSDGTFTSATWNLQATNYDAVPIYAWFQDYAGNRSSSASATATYDFRAPVSINYNAPNNQMNAGDSIIFTVDGLATYNWTLTSATGVAEITDGDNAEKTIKNGATSITVKGKAAGTFTLSAEPTVTGTTLNTSTITVVQTDTTYDIALSVGWNLIAIPNLPADTVIATMLSGIAGKYSIVWGEFNPATSAWKSYDPLKSPALNSLKTLGPGKGYWIKVTQAGTLSVTGAEASKSVDLLTGWNLIGCALPADMTIGTMLNGIAGKYSIVWGEFNPTTSAWKSYDPSKSPALNSLKNMGPGKGYWLKATQNSNLSY